MYRLSRRTALQARPLLPGHARPPAYAPEDDSSIPGVDPAERRKQRAAWVQRHTRRFDRTELTGRFGLALAIAVMALVTLVAVSTPSNALERAEQMQTQAMITQTETPDASVQG